ncbi:hypothetical protein ACQP2F_14495 [Actinoplanes sp. CA-030573]|uniref:hypothetical protein n=1 Tax=Actinoplanes sp. CA-030573 TaxID=3239898 RepID=UPI003D92ED62
MMGPRVRDAVPDPAPITVSLHIVNTYQRYPSVETTVADAVVPACPIAHPPATDAEQELLEQWAEQHLYPFTGAGHPDGDAFYDLTVTASTLPWLAGTVFSWGY